MEISGWHNPWFVENYDRVAVKGHNSVYEAFLFATNAAFCEQRSKLLDVFEGLAQIGLKIEWYDDNNKYVAYRVGYFWHQSSFQCLLDM